MSMGRYLCQLCWSIVHYGERHPCFFYKDDDEVYTVPPPNEPDEVEGKHEETQETHSGNWNDNNLHISAAAEANHNEESKKRNSSVIENYGGISLVPASRRKRRFSMFPPFSGITSTNVDSECASNTNTERDDNEDGEKNSKVQRKSKSASAEATRMEESVSIGIYTCSSSLGSVAHGEAENIAGSSGIQTQCFGSENERAFVCDVCGGDFASRGNLEKHRRTHTGEKQFACPTCSQAFTRKSDLERHIRTHTGEKPFACDICSKRFARKDYLEVHLRTHTGERPYKCTQCDWDFGDPSSYKRHLKNIHGEKGC